MYGTKNANQYDGDCILEVNNLTYIGRLMPSYQRTSDDLPVEQQPVWQIERIDTLATPIGEQTEPGQETQYSYKTRRMYPNGIEDYRWCMSQATEYDYDYRH